MKKEETTVKVAIGLLLLMVIMLFPVDLWAQSLEDFENGFEEQVNVFKNIAKRVLEVAFIVGLLGVIWAYTSKSQSAKEYLTQFVIAIIIGGIGRALLLD